MNITTWPFTLKEAWLEEYDLDTFTLIDVLNELASRGILDPLVNWYADYFGDNGFVRKIHQDENQIATDFYAEIPAGMSSIVQWITN